MNAFTVILLPEMFLGALVFATWWWVLRQPSAGGGWRQTASLVALLLPTLALLFELLLAAIIAFYGSLSDLDEAAAHGGWAWMVAILSLGLVIATGLFPLCGIILGILSRGSARTPAVIWSCAVLGTVFVNFFFAINSFH